MNILKMLKKFAKSAAYTTILVGHCVGILHYQYMSPKKLDVPQKKDKNIVVVGAGIIGLSTAYYLSKNP